MWVKEEVSREMKKYSELHENKKKTNFVKCSKSSAYRDQMHILEKKKNLKSVIPLL